MDSLVVLTHNGMGDQLICNGLVRRLAAEHPNLSIVCKQENAESVLFMYRDQPNIRVVTIEDDNQISPAFGAHPSVLQTLRQSGHKLLLLGLHRGHVQPGSGFADVLYDQAGVSRQSRYLNFHVVRDVTLETNFAVDGEYLFLHDDPCRGFNISLTTDMRIIRPGKADQRPGSHNIFSFVTLMQNASEIRCIDSAFAHLADLLDLCPGRRFLHCTAKNPADTPELLFRRPGWTFVH